jgi:hypothetical protein
MKILLRLTISMVLVSILLGLNHELLIRSIIFLVLASTTIKCTQAVFSTPYPATQSFPAEAPLPATGRAPSNRYPSYPVPHTGAV